MKSGKKNIEDRIHIYLPIAIIAIIGIIVYGIFSFFMTDKTIIQDSSKDIVYTAYKDEENEKEIPYINVVSLSDEVNKSIKEFVDPYLNKETNKIEYHYQVNGNILSLFITVEDFSIEGPEDVKFLSYIINLKTKKILTKEEVLEMFDLTEESIIKYLDDSFRKYYNDEITQRIISINTTYEEYLKMHEITNFKDEIYYDIKDGKLNVYLDFNEWASEETENYFVNHGYLFEIN